MKNSKSDLIIDDETAKNYLNKISSFININKLSIIIIIIFVISCISGSIIYTGIKKSSNEKASFVLYELIDIIKNGSDKTTSLKEIENRYSTLKEKYSSSSSARMADIIYASYLYDSEKYIESSEIYEHSIKNFEKDSLFGRIVISGVGYSQIMLGNIDKALVFFDKISISDKYLSRDEALVNIGIIHKKSGNTEKYIESFIKAKEIKEDSIYTSLIKERFPG